MLLLFPLRLNLDLLLRLHNNLYDSMKKRILEYFSDELKFFFNVIKQLYYSLNKAYKLNKNRIIF